ncbi:hypothetical protein BaRGS_00033919 [Batillaria attramentaria]|uniref:Uncharacterized protein n=1 Tax=Batillaria attramentaria TaxID=370345 RepID=A0ABD0JIK8_9CAEN
MKENETTAASAVLFDWRKTTSFAQCCLALSFFLGDLGQPGARPLTPTRHCGSSRMSATLQSPAVTPKMSRISGFRKTSDDRKWQ